MVAERTEARVITICESLCEDLRRRVGLTTFRIELQRPGVPLVVSLRAPDAVVARAALRDASMSPPPARLETALHHKARHVATLWIEDERRGQYPDTARATCERIAGEYAPELDVLLRSEPV